MTKRSSIKTLFAAAVVLLVLTGTAFARTKHAAKPLHKNTPHTYTKHTATKHPKATHAHS